MLKLAGRTKIRVGALGLALASAALGVSLFFLVAGGGSAPPLPLDGVDFAGLQQQGISLKAPPPGAQARIQTQDAVAKAGFPLPVKQIVLGRLVTDNVPLLDRLVWIVSYDATSQPIPGGPIGTTDDAAGAMYDPATYMIAFVDAQTGDFLFSVQANHLK